VPLPDLTEQAYSISSSARASSVGGIFKVERLRGPEVDRQLEPGRPLSGKIGGLGALEDAAITSAKRLLHQYLPAADI